MKFPKTISLFSGCGGCDLGLEQAGFDIKFAADIDKNSCNTYSANFGIDATNIDLSAVSPEQILTKSGIKKNGVDLIVGGPPCQGFSSAGSKDWNDARNKLLKKFVEVVVTLKPTWFVMENVEGLLTSGGGFFLHEVISRFLESGYWVKCKKVYMETYGIPQKRKRVFIIGNLEKCNFEFPQPFYQNELSLRDEEILSVAKIIKKIKNNNQEKSNSLLNYSKKEINPIVLDRIKHLHQGQTMKDLPPHLQHESYKRRSFRRVMDGTPTEKRGGAPSGLKRLSESKISPTITSAASAEFIHPKENRFLTLRECAALQSFPDSYEFNGTSTSIALQIGNAIPPQFMKILGQHIQNIATWKKTKSKGKWLGIEATKSEGKSPALQKTLEILEQITLDFT